MSDAYIGEIRIFGFNFNPRSWARCNGQLIAISQNTALFSILGTTYGGNGSTTFALPNLIERAAIGVGTGPSLSSRVLGEVGGSPTVTLLATQIPTHTHQLNAGVLSAPNAAQNVATPGPDTFFGLSGPNNTYSDQTTPNTSFNPAALASAGGSLPHENMQPYLAMNFCICMFGVFPSRN